jgi:hypothetical protein
MSAVKLSAMKGREIPETAMTRCPFPEVLAMTHNLAVSEMSSYPPCPRGELARPFYRYPLWTSQKGRFGLHTLT